MKIKVCGITNIEDAVQCVKARAYAIGFIFCPQSPRSINPLDAASIIAKVKGTVKTVGVFVNHSVKEILEIAELTKIDCIQLHGQEPLDIIQQLRDIPVIRSVTIHDHMLIDDITVLNHYDAVLIDLPKDTPSNNIDTFIPETWKLAKVLSKKMKVYLAGRMTATNFQQAVDAVSPYAIDLCSGLEIYPGNKCHEKILHIFEISQRRSS